MPWHLLWEKEPMQSPSDLSNVKISAAASASSAGSVPEMGNCFWWGVAPGHDATWGVPLPSCPTLPGSRVQIPLLCGN